MALEAILGEQEGAIEAVDRNKFHALDDRFHREICVGSDVGYVWDLIHESKAHMDRIRMLSLDASSQRHAYGEHVAIFDAISARDPDGAATAVNTHLSRILVLIEQIKTENHGWFTQSAG